MTNEHFKLIRSQTHPLTKEFLAKFLAYPPSPTELDRKDKRVKHLRDKAERGLLIPFQWSIAEFNGMTYRMNGRHSSEMLAALNGKFPNDLFVHLDEYSVESDGGLAMLFRQFDDRASGRSPADVAGAYQGLEPDLREVPRPPAKLAVEAITWYRKNVEKAPYEDGDDRYRVFHERALHAYIAWVSELFAHKVPELANDGVMAAIFGTYEANRARAEIFWPQVAKGGDEYQEGAPDRVLSEWLRAAIEEGTQENAAKLTPSQKYQGCVYAWNAWRRDQASIKDIKYQTKRGFSPILD